MIVTYGRGAVTLAMPVEPEANELLTRSPLALLIGMLLDQQVPLERAFSAPLDLVRRLGHEPTAAELAGFDPAALDGHFLRTARAAPLPQGDGSPGAGAGPADRGRYDGEAEQVWASARTGAELLERVAALPGFGAQKAQIFVALLGKQLGVQPRGWRQAAGKFGARGSHMSVADITDAETLARVRSYKQELKAAAKAKAAAPAGAGAP